MLKNNDNNFKRMFKNKHRIYRTRYSGIGKSASQACILKRITLHEIQSDGCVQSITGTVLTATYPVKSLLGYAEVGSDLRHRGHLRQARIA